MATNRRRAAAPGLAAIETSAPLPERCNCPPLSLLHERRAAQQEEEDEDNERLVPATQFLNDRIRAFLDDYFPRVSLLSVVLLHVSQQEHIHIAPPGTLAYKRRRYHAPPGLLAQILVNVRRAIRADDKMLIHEDSGAALILPDVDRYGASAILERIYHSVALLQAETVIPPLTRETTILMGSGSYPEPGESLEHLLYHAGFAARSLTLRPALLPQQAPAPREIAPRRAPKSNQPQRFPGIPFMTLPPTLPARLKQLIPHQLAHSLRCVPVGRDHNCLTVAMANPTNSDQIHLLHEITGMTIFPVSCTEESLTALLEQGW
jgi:hypothetical protein